MKPLARSKNLVVQQAENEVLVYDLNTNKAICLNETSALVWQNCDGKKSFLEIQKAVEKKFGELVTEDFIKFAVDQLKKENLIENKDEIETGFNGLSRREVIKRVGFTSLVALPIISAILAPQAALAASNLANGQACTLSTQCASGCCREDRGVFGNPGNATNNGSCGNPNPFNGDPRCQGDGLGTS